MYYCDICNALLLRNVIVHCGIRDGTLRCTIRGDGRLLRHIYRKCVLRSNPPRTQIKHASAPMEFEVFYAFFLQVIRAVRGGRVNAMAHCAGQWYIAMYHSVVPVHAQPCLGRLQQHRNRRGPLRGPCAQVEEPGTVVALVGEGDAHGLQLIKAAFATNARVLVPEGTLQCTIIYKPPTRICTQCTIVMHH